jgi:hypothetical protein
MTAVTSTAAAVTTHSRVLVLTGSKGQGQLPVQFAFDDTSFTFEDSSTGTWASYSDCSVSLSLDTRPIGSSRVHVPLTHVLSVDMSGSAVDAHVLVRKGRCLKLVNVSAFLGDNSAERSSAKDWVQDVMTAAYSGL